MSAPAPSSAPTRPEEYPPAGGEHYWAKATRELRHRLAKEVPHDVLRELHRKSPARHLAIAARQFLILAAASGISSLQFTRWHLTHHAELGDFEADPKRHYLSPKINKAWYKLLYFTPALFPIYFRAARRETVTYPPALQRRIAWERRGTIAFHLAVMAAIFLRSEEHTSELQ